MRFYLTNPGFPRFGLKTGPTIEPDGSSRRWCEIGFGVFVIEWVADYQSQAQFDADWRALDKRGAR